MARGTVVNEGVVSQASTDEFREGYERTFGDKKPVRGRWVATPSGLVPAAEYVPPSTDAQHALIIADRIHEGSTFDDGERVWDTGSRAKRRQMMKETGLVERDNYGPGWSERRKAEREREAERRIDKKWDEHTRRLVNQRKLRD